MKKRILVVDDEQDMLSGVAKLLARFGFICTAANSGKAALQLIDSKEFDVILCDLYMPDIDGFAVIEHSKKIMPEVPIIIFTAFGTIDRAVEAIKRGAYDFIEKPFESEHLIIVINRALEHKSLINENRKLLSIISQSNKYENLVGKSRKMQEVYEMIDKVAPTDANILITGESGSGKELVARAIHNKSKRAKESFVPVNCSAFPESLFEAELFGYERGAFTGAAKRKIGLLEYANGGTFFMDEVFEMPLSIQAKFLRVLQDKKLRRLGGNELIVFDARIVSATNINPEDAIKEHRLREDFYYRINVVNIHIPPLRERKEDIKLLANYFLNSTLQSSPKVISGFQNDVLEVFQNYSWPGNVRELENVVKRAVVLSSSNYIELKDIPREIRLNKTGYDFGNISLSQAKQLAADKVEKEYLLFLLEKCEGNVTKMSKLSGMTRRNLHRVLNKHKIDPRDWRKGAS